MSKAAKPMPARRSRSASLKQIHDFIRSREGDAAAYAWLVATVANQAEQIDVLRKAVSNLKSRITRTRNETRSHHAPAPRPRSYESQ